MLRTIIFLLAVLLAASCSHAEDFQGAEHAVDYDNEPISYSTTKPVNPVETLKRRIDLGQISLNWDEKFGYLPALLKELNIPVSSQTLVFSKTSLQRKFINPSNPRSLYFNDDIYVGFIPGAPVMEVSVADPKLGGVFYSVKNDRNNPPEFERNSDCLQCHGAQRSLGVPGHFMRSVATDLTGELDSTEEIGEQTHCAPLKTRWAGWYVTGKHGDQTHRGNLVGRGAFKKEKEEPNHRGNLTSLAEFFEPTKYPTGGSDIVALMVLGHQAHMHNYISRMNLESAVMMATYGHLRYMRIQTEAFLRQLLFVEEAQLTAPIEGDPMFSKDFAAKAVRDSKGRSLRDLNLQTRLFKYPCSFLIYSEAFDAIPSEMKEIILKQLHEILTGQNTSSVFAKLTSEDRLAILEILRETKPNLPEYWRR